MELRSGYKRTEAGVIPEDWEAKPLRGCVSIAHGFAFSSKYFTAHGRFRLTTPGHFHEAGGFRDIGSNQKFYVGPVPVGYVLHRSDMIVAMTEQADGLLGSAALIPQDEYYLHNQRLGRVRTLSSEVDLGYLYYVFNSASYRAKVRETAAGTKVKHTSPEKLLEIFVSLPPAPEQRAIAEALGDVDALLGGLDRLIAKKRDLKQAAMQQLLSGKTRLPGFDHTWEMKRFGEVAEMGSGGTPLSTVPRYYHGNIPWVSISDMTRCGRLIVRTEKTLTALGLANSAAQMFPAGTVLYAMYASLGECSIAGVQLCTSQAILGIRVKDALNAEFLYYFLISLKPTVKMLAQQGTQSNLNKGMVENFRVPVPPLAEQTAIANALSDIDKELSYLEARRDKTHALKQGMMQELLTGKTRLVTFAAAHA